MNNYLQLLNNSKMTLIMSLPQNDPELAKIAFDYGADVVKVHINVQHRASGTCFNSLDEEKDSLSQMLAKARGPMGIVLGGDVLSARRDADAAAEMGFSFASLYGHHMPISVLSHPILATMMACDYTYNNDEIRYFKEIGVDVLEASIVPPQDYGTPLTGREIAKYRNLCVTSKLPVVVPSQKKILPSEISALYNAGVKGIMIGAVVTGKEIESIKNAVCDFKEAILKL